MPASAPPLEITVVHEGRGGRVEIEERRYAIEHINGGRFCIHFPDGNRHARLGQHLQALMALQASEPTRWHVENRSRKYAPRDAVNRDKDQST